MTSIVTHLNPDLDAIGAVWLIKRYLPNWSQSEVLFVPAGGTLNDAPPDADEDVIHVDTGLGKFDHHQNSEYTSATRKVFNDLIDNNHIKQKDQPALERLVDFITFTDHFQEVTLPDATADIYDLSLHEMVHGLRSYIPDDRELVSYVSTLLDASLVTLKMKLRAEVEIQEGETFETQWGKGLAMETRNEHAVKLAIKMGYKIVLRYDQDRKLLNIKSFPDKSFDLTPLYTALSKADPHATWFFHASKRIIVNGSTRNPAAIPTTLTFSEIIRLVKERH